MVGKAQPNASINTTTTPAGSRISWSRPGARATEMALPKIRDGQVVVKRAGYILVALCDILEALRVEKPGSLPNERGHIMTRGFTRLVLIWAIGTLMAGVAGADSSPGDAMLAEYFRVETARLRDACLADVQDREDWEQRREESRRQLREMLGIDPLPERTDLRATVTGRTERETFVVERLHFQSLPGLYVTANLYVPRDLAEPAATVLYVCGHGSSRRDGVSYGNKVAYHHHAVWFARHGFVCLIIDTLQLGEIEGIHHGTYRYDRWWWLNRGYTPAGVEAWNGIRALDYLETREEVDPERIGVTGRSGGGAYSWWIAALDERIRAAVPVAGITDLEDHVVGGCVEGHCDCMYFVNTYRWDYPQVAALVAPRPLLISNTDRDRIFPLEGVLRTHARVREIYGLYGAGERLGLQIAAGPHRDTQELRIHAFRWLNQHLRDDDSLIERAAERIFDPAELQVFQELPEDQINTSIDETFVPRAEPALPDDAEQWRALRDGWYQALREKSFRGWPDPEPLGLERLFAAEREGVRLEGYQFASDHTFRLRMIVVEPVESRVGEAVEMHVLDQAGWEALLARYGGVLAEELGVSESEGESGEESGEAFALAAERLARSPGPRVYLAPRGVGPTAWDPSPRGQVQIRRRFYLLGQTWQGMQVWDVRRAIQALRALGEGRFAEARLELHARQQMAGVALYASLFEAGVARLVLDQLPASHREGPYLLNVTRYLDLPQAVALAAERGQVQLNDVEPEAWSYPEHVSRALEWPETRLGIEAR